MIVAGLRTGDLASIASIWHTSDQATAEALKLAASIGRPLDPAGCAGKTPPAAAGPRRLRKAETLVPLDPHDCVPEPMRALTRLAQ